MHDPLEFLGPFLSWIWKTNLDGDESLTVEILNVIRSNHFIHMKCFNNWKNQHEYYLHRWVDITDTELDVFVNANHQGNGAVAYLQTCISNENIFCNVFFSKKQGSSNKFRNRREFTDHLKITINGCFMFSSTWKIY